MRLRAELWSDVPVMFAVVDESTIARLKPLADVTGITLQLQLGNSIKAARVLVPKLKRIVIVGDAWERQAFRSHYVQELSQLKDEFEIIDLSGLSMAKIVERVATLPNDAAIIYTSIYFDDEAEMTYIPRDALNRVAQAANRPVVTDVAPLVGHGKALAGFSVLSPNQADKKAHGLLCVF